MAASSHAGTPTPLVANSSVDEPLSPEQATAVLRQYLQQISPAWSLSRADVRDLAPRLRRHTFTRGQVILPRRVRADCLALVVRGRVAVWSEGQESGRPAAVLEPGSIFGKSMLVEGQPSPALLQAATPCELWFLLRADLEATLAGRPTRRRRATLLRLVPWLAACLIGALLVALPPVRQAAALAPMAVGQWCQHQQQAGCAERAWTLAAGLAPADANPQLALGMLYYERGDTAAAEQSFVTALEMDPGSPEAHNNLGLLYAGQGRYEQAVSMFEMALNLEPGSAAVEHNLAFSLQALGITDEALAHYRQAVALGDQQASTQANMAIAYLDTGQYAEAAAAAWQALAYDATLAPAYAVLGAVALANGDAAGAVPTLQQSIALDAGYSPAYFYLGLVYKTLDQRAQAQAAFNQALATAPDEGMRVRIRRHLAEVNSPSP